MIRKAFRGNRSRVFLILVALSSLPAGWWLREALSDRTEPASADIPVVKCEELIGTFDAYPLLYLGESFEDLPLNYCRRRQTSAIADRVPPTDSFVFAYGTCTIKPGRSSCNLPLQVIVYPRCDPPPPTDPKTPTEAIRGVQAKVLRTAALFVETPQYTVKVSAGIEDVAGDALVRRAFLELRGANALAQKLTADKPLADPALVDAPTKDKDACSSDTTLKDPSASEPVVSGPQLDLAVTDNGTSLTVTLNASGNTSAPYEGAQIRFDMPSGLLNFSGGSGGGPLAAATCFDYVTPNLPAPGRTLVNFVCSLLGLETASGGGALLNMTLSEAGNGCAAVVMDTVPGASFVTGVDGAPQSHTYGVTTVQVATVGTGGVCPP